MFSKFIKARNPSAEPAAVTSPEPVAELAWEARLQAAMGSDLELLALAQQAPAVDIKLAAVLALTGEEALRQAEREFRTHDRRVHSAAKQRYEAQVRRREMQARAEQLITAAAVLAGEPALPANRLVELDHAWRALDLSVLDDAQTARFSDLQAGLAQRLREHGERMRSVSRWCAEARQVLARLAASGAGIASTALEPHELVAALAAASEEARATLATIPLSIGASTHDADVIATLDQAIQAALRDAPLIEVRLMILDELQRGPQPQHAGPQEGQAVPAVESPVQRWQALAPVADQDIGNALDARFEAWLRNQDEARRKRQSDRRQHADAKAKDAQQARLQAVMKVLDAAETALAAGHLAEAVKHLPILQAASKNGDAGSSLQARIDSAQAEIVRLKGWQHWGGGQVRQDLVEEAEVLARSVTAEDGTRPAKLAIGQLEKNIERLRAAWKELDRLGGATNKAIWQRFDSALKAAHVPVAEHLARLNEARLENLALRKNLLAALDALNIGSDDSGATTDWKEVARTLAHFQTEWRKLGPLEHTVPHKQRAGLTERMTTSVTRLEEPLRDVQREAQAEREQFIVRARQLSENAQNRDVVARVRELQAQWQQHAKSRPLPHRVENALWAEFKAATGAVMSRREEALKARDTQAELNQATREALIRRLQEPGPDDPPAEIKRILAAAETEWQQAGGVPGNQATRLESRFREARDRAMQFIAGSAQRRWHGTCDALVAKLALCGEREALSTAAPADLAAIEARWAVLPALPTRWEQALQARFKSSDGNAGGSALDDLLLQLESALDIPSPATFQAARRSLKLVAMKNAMEGRRSASPAPADINEMTAATFACMRYSAEQSHRLEAIIVALRRSAPGSLGG